MNTEERIRRAEINIENLQARYFVLKSGLLLLISGELTDASLTKMKERLIATALAQSASDESLIEMESEFDELILAVQHNQTTNPNHR